MQQSPSSGDDLLLQRAHNLRAEGIKPYARQFTRTHTLVELFDQYEDIEDYEVREPGIIRICGRVTSIQAVGDDVEMRIEDQSYHMDVVASSGKLDQASLERLRRKVYCGDILGFVVDTISRTNDGLTVGIADWRYLALANLPVPRSLEVERRRTERHLHWASSLDAREGLRMRAMILSQTRRFMSASEFLEVILPYPVPGQHEAVRGDRRHHIAQLLVGGIEQFYEIRPSLEATRNDWLSHPQALILSCSQVAGSLESAMLLIEQLIGRLTTYLHTVDVVSWQPLEVLNGVGASKLKSVFEEEHSLEIVLSPSWTRRTTRQLIVDVLNIDFPPQMSVDKALTRAKEGLLELEISPSWQSAHDVMTAVFYQYASPTLIQPTFVIHPSQKPDSSDRFELYINGILFARGESEVTDPEGFNQPGEDNEAALQLRMLGMPPAISFEVYLDRITMLLLNKTDIRDVLS